MVLTNNNSPESSQVIRTENGGGGDEKKSSPLTFSSFIDLKEACGKKKINVAIYGKPSTGKTRFCLSAPEPVYIIDTEIGSPLLRNEFPNKDIKILGVTPEGVRDGYEQIEEAINNLLELIRNGKVGTVAIDSVSDLWEYTQDYAKDKTWGLKPEDRLKFQFDWGVINKLYKKLIKKLFVADCNLILVGRAQEQRDAKGQPLGTYVGKWQKDTPFDVDFVLEFKKNIKNGQVNFFAILEKSRVQGKDSIGKIIDYPSWDKFNDVINK